MTDVAGLTKEQLWECHVRLIKYAVRLFSTRGWKRDHECVGPGGVTPDGIATDAILSLLEGPRDYDRVQYPDPLPVLFAIVRSKIYHHAHSSETQRVQPWPRNQQHQDDDPVDMEFEGKEPGPVEICIVRDIMTAMKAKAVEKQDVLVQGILDNIAVGTTRPAEIADKLGVCVEKINNAQKRLRRMFLEVLGQQKQETRS